MNRGLLLAGSLLALVAAGCGGHAGINVGSNQVAPVVSQATGAAASPVPGARTVIVTLTEYAVQLDTTSIPAGPVHLVVTNSGQRGHELQVYPRSAVAGGHTMAGMGRVPGLVGLLNLVPVGQTRVLDVTLTAGAWELACHLQDSAGGQQFDHYDRGIKTTLTVA